VHEHPGLIYNLATGKWLFRNQDDFWAMVSVSDALDLAAFLEVEILDRSASDYLVIAKGRAIISDQNNRQCVLDLKPFSTDEEDSSIVVTPAVIELSIVDCLDGFHEDQWVETEAVLGTEGIRTLGLKFFLPETDVKQVKVLDFYLGDKKLTTTKMQRGQLEEIWLDLPANEEPKNITIRASYKEPNSQDERSLGMIFAEINMNLAGWQSVETIL